MSQELSPASQQHELLMGIPAEVIERLPQPLVVTIEKGASTIRNCNELAMQPNPFEVTRGTQVLFSTTHEQSIAKTDLSKGCALTIEETSSSQISTVARQHAPVLGRLNKERMDILEGARKSISSDFTSMNHELQDTHMQIKHDQSTDQTLQNLSHAYHNLCDIAVHLPAPDALAELEETLTLEDHARHHDVMAVGISKYSTMVDPGSSSQHPIAITPHQHNRADKTDLQTMLQLGNTDRSVRRAHRTSKALRKDRKTLEEATKEFANLPANGTRLHQFFKTVVHEAALAPLENQLQVLGDGAAINTSVGIEQESDQAATLTTERYLAQHAEVINTGIRTHRIVLTDQGREELQSLCDTPLMRAVKRATRAQEVDRVTNPYTDVVADEAFWRECTIAKDILRSASRLEHPDAAQLSDRLHRVRLGNDRMSLSPEESGFIMAILADEITLLLQTVQRIQQGASKDSNDTQVQKFRHEKPSQFATLHSFQLNPVVQKLRHILEDPYKRSSLQAVVKQEAVHKIEHTVRKLLPHKDQS